MTELHQFTALNHLLSSYVATLSLYNKEHSYLIKDFEDLKPVVNNTTYLMNLSIEVLSSHTSTISNVPLIRQNIDDERKAQGNEMIIHEQFDLIQKVAYDIFKLCEKIKI
jgi:hypothetical protein